MVTTTLLTTGNGEAAAAILGAAGGTQDPVPVTPSVPAAMAQTITINVPDNQTLGMAEPALSTTASSGLAVSFTSLTPAICTLSGTTLTVVSACTSSVCASQAGNATYFAATSVSSSFIVAAASALAFATAPLLSGACTYSISGVASALSSTASSSTSGNSGSATRSCTNGFWATVGTATCTAASALQSITLNAPAAQDIGTFTATKRVFVTNVTKCDDPEKTGFLQGFRFLHQTFEQPRTANKRACTTHDGRAARKCCTARFKFRNKHAVL